MDAGVPTRELYWGVSDHWIMYPLFLLVVAVVVFFFIKRFRRWAKGAPENRFDRKGSRLAGMLKEVFSQRRIVRRGGIGPMHLLMFWGMTLCLVGTVCVALQSYLGLPLVQGDFYLYFLSLTLDIAGVAFIVGASYALVRRMRGRAQGIDDGFVDEAVLILIIAVLVSGFVVEGLRIAGTHDPWALWSPVGLAVSMLFSGMGQADIEQAHCAVWWAHLAIAFGFLALFTVSKMAHVFFIPGNIYLRPLEPRGTLPFIDFEDESVETFGAQRLEDLTWKDLFDSQACIDCGRCADRCPARLSGKDLSPQKLIRAIGHDSSKHSPSSPIRGQKTVLASSEACQLGSERLVGSVISEEALWECTTCGACTEQCPAMVEHVRKIVRMRTFQVSMESAFPPELNRTFRNMETNGNPWGLGWQTRSQWSEGLGVPLLSENPHAEYLFWPGCAGAFDARNRKVAAALVQVLRYAGVDFAVLGNSERCCGDAARRLGNEYLYQTLASENIETLRKSGVKKIITQCPHCLHALSVDYRQLGGDFEVIHHTEFIAGLLASGALPSGMRGDARVVYHDSCYLGRYHDIFDAPRNLIEASGATVVEPEFHRRESQCCGAGGGQMWLEEKGELHMNAMRVEHVVRTHAACAATACPYCLTMLTDGLAGRDEAMPVKDVAELLAEALPEKPPAQDEDKAVRG